MFNGFYTGKSVWLSGSTGFKGAWLAEWLTMMGARVHGFALTPDTQPSLFVQIGLAARIDQEIGDIRDAAVVHRSIAAAQPDIVFHLAAQALVRRSYSDPAKTYATNVMGTVHVLEALRDLSKPCAAIFVTSDKCYENTETFHSYREDDPLGGHDPYSSSKAAAEIAISSWRRSFFVKHTVRIASARSGNVIGGGDWAADRIVPDCIRALQKDEPIIVRNPEAVRPWQYVLEPLRGYLCLAASLWGDKTNSPLDSAFNFGSDPGESRTVGNLVEEVLKHWPGRWKKEERTKHLHEAQMLYLSTKKARASLGWEPLMGFTDAVKETVSWYKEVYENPTKARKCLDRQLRSYIDHAKGTMR